jgi:TRAP-type uncharacterized transport system substrate-binding protein
MQKVFQLLLIVLMIASQAACGGEAKVDTGGKAPTATVAEKTTYVTIGTGAVAGIYYTVGGVVTEVVNKKEMVFGVHCKVESTGGSVFNVNAVMAGDLQFGLVRSDWNQQAFKGLAIWKERGAQKDLRSVFSLPSAEVPSAVAANEAITATPSHTDTPGDTDTERFRGMTTLITSAKVPEKIVYAVTKAVFENFHALQGLHPAFSGLTPKRMLEGLSTPIHPGALKYYKEAGLM